MSLGVEFMAINISKFEKYTHDAIKHFWQSREIATQNQEFRGISDQGNRSSVTAGKNMDGFAKMVKQIIIDNGLDENSIFHTGRNNLNLPGFYRPTKNWDLIVVSNNKLIAVIEFKSQVGPSFGNNFNNRVEEALGNSTDILAAFKKGAFGESLKPFLGYIFVLEECDKSMSNVRFTSPHFPAFPEFNNTSYAKRYDIFCRKIIQEGLYDSASLVLTKRDHYKSGEYRCLSEITNINNLRCSAINFADTF